MNPMHQLTRRPVKAAFGALLLALAGVILALSGGQFWAAARTRAGVEETYTTVAVVTGRISSDEVLTPSAEGGGATRRASGRTVPWPPPSSWRSRNSRTGASSVPGPEWAWSAGTAPA
ncbi:MAG: hypothetical protein ACLR8R_02130 [Oscillospiraceae bacterium]